MCSGCGSRPGHSPAPVGTAAEEEGWSQSRQTLRVTARRPLCAESMGGVTCPPSSLCCGRLRALALQTRKLKHRQDHEGHVVTEGQKRSPPGSLWRPPACAQQGPPCPQRPTKVRAEVRREAQKSSVWLSGPVQALSPLEECSPRPHPPSLKCGWACFACLAEQWEKC